MSDTAQRLSHFRRRTGYITALVLVACTAIWVCAGLGFPLAILATVGVLAPREEVAALLWLSIIPLDLAIFAATVVWIRWLNHGYHREYLRLLDDVFERLAMTGEPLDGGGRIWKRDGVWVSLSSRRLLLPVPTRPRRHLEVAVTTPPSFEAVFQPSVPILLPSTCASPPRPSCSGDPQAERWLDDERLQRIVYALPFGASRLHAGPTGVVWRFTAARAGLQPGDVNEASLRQWLDDLAGLSAGWASDPSGTPSGST